MIDHVSVGVADLEPSARFYEAALAALGLKRLVTRPGTRLVTRAGVFLVDRPAIVSASNWGGAHRQVGRTHILKTHLIAKSCVASFGPSSNPFLVFWTMDAGPTKNASSDRPKVLNRTLQVGAEQNLAAGDTSFEGAISPEHVDDARSHFTDDVAGRQHGSR